MNEILDVSISFLNDHLEEILGPTKIEENHSKCINLTRVSVLSYLVGNLAFNVLAFSFSVFV